MRIVHQAEVALPRAVGPKDAIEIPGRRVKVIQAKYAKGAVYVGIPANLHVIVLLTLCSADPEPKSPARRLGVVATNIDLQRNPCSKAWSA